MWNVWRTVLEENETAAKARLEAIEVLQNQINDEAKALRAHKLQIAKKVKLSILSSIVLKKCSPRYFVRFLMNV